MENKKYRLLVQYDGTHYHGWQRQNGLDTIQSRLIEALTKGLGEEPIGLVASGRTDAGVHARAQIVSFRINTAVPPEKIAQVCNCFLPDDIRLLRCKEVQPGFHAIKSAQKKTYRYFFSTRRVSIFHQRFISYCPYRLDLSLMNDCLRIFEGTHDFSGFRTGPAVTKSSLRTLHAVALKRSVEASYVFEFTGNGFLRGMVRNLVGALWEVGRGKVAPEALHDQLKGAVNGKIGSTAPAKGLVLWRVYYGRETKL